MNNEFLSQDEVDTLLKDVGSDEDDVGNQLAEGMIPYSRATQERIVNVRMPTLEVINERFATLLPVGLFNFMRRTPNVTAGPVRIIKYADFTRDLVFPANLNIAHVKPLRGKALVIFDAALVFLVVDTLFGGNGRVQTRIEGREFTPTEQRIIERLLKLVFGDYEKSWASVYPLVLDYIRSETQPQFANIATAAEMVVVTTFSVEFREGVSGGGNFHICIPYATIEPIKDLICASVQPDPIEPDQRWLRLLAKHVQITEVELVANLVSMPITVNQLLHMQVGDVLKMDLPDVVTVAVDGVSILECKYGALNGQYAIKVDRVLALREDTAVGEAHG